MSLDIVAEQDDSTPDPEDEAEAEERIQRQDREETGETRETQVAQMTHASESRLGDRREPVTMSGHRTERPRDLHSLTGLISGYH